MESKNLLEIMEDIVGKRCRFESNDGAYRDDTVHHVQKDEIRYGGITIEYPMKICFDASETDFINISLLKAIDIIE